MLMLYSHHLLDNGQICRWNIVCYCLYFLFLEMKISTLTEKTRGKYWTVINTSISILLKFYSIKSVMCQFWQYLDQKNETLNGKKAFLVKMYCASKTSKTVKPEKVVTGACVIQEERLPFFHITIIIYYFLTVLVVELLQDWSSTLNRLSKGRG